MDLSQIGVSSNLPEFIERKIRNSEWFNVTGDINAVTNTIEYVPVSGKTAYLFEAKVTISTHGGITQLSGTSSTVVTDNIVKAGLKIDGVQKDIVNIGYQARLQAVGAQDGMGAGYSFTDGRFNCLGLSLAGDGIKKITIENITDNGSAIATMSGWISDT